MERPLPVVLEELKAAHTVASVPSKALHIHHLNHHILELEKELNRILEKVYGSEKQIMTGRLGKLEPQQPS